LVKFCQLSLGAGTTVSSLMEGGIKFGSKKAVKHTKMCDDYMNLLISQPHATLMLIIIVVHTMNMRGTAISIKALYSYIYSMSYFKNQISISDK